MGTGETAHIGKKDVVGPAHPDAVTGQAQENKRKNNDIVMNVFAGPLPMVFKPGQVSYTADTYQTLISTRLVSLGDWGQGGTLVAATT